MKEALGVPPGVAGSNRRDGQIETVNTTKGEGEASE